MAIQKLKGRLGMKKNLHEHVNIRSPLHSVARYSAARDQGFIMIIALVLTFIVALGGLAGMHSTLFAEKIVLNTQNQAAAEHLAHNVNMLALQNTAAVSSALARAEDANFNNWPTQTMDLPDMEGTAQVQVSARKVPVLGASINALSQYVVSATSDVETRGVQRNLSIGYVEIAPVAQ